MKPEGTRLPVAAIAAALVAALAVAGWALLAPGRSTTYTGSAMNPSATGPVVLLPDADRPPAEAMAFRDGDGKALRLEDFRGRVILLNLWATWCPPCVAEMPSLDGLQAKLGGRGFQVVAVSLDRGGTATARDWLGRKGLDHLAAFAADPSRFPDALLPTTLLIDGQGRVAWRGMGGRDWTDPAIQGQIVALMRE